MSGGSRRWGKRTRKDIGPNKRVVDTVCNNLRVSAFTTRRPPDSLQQSVTPWKWFAALKPAQQTEVLVVNRDSSWFKIFRQMCEERKKSGKDGVFVFIEQPRFTRGQDQHTRFRFLPWGRLVGNSLPSSSGSRGVASEGQHKLIFSGNRESRSLLSALRMSKHRQGGWTLMLDAGSFHADEKKGLWGIQSLIDIASSEHYCAPIKGVAEHALNKVMETGRLQTHATNPHIATVFVYSLASFVAFRLRKAMLNAYDSRQQSDHYNIAASSNIHGADAKSLNRKDEMKNPRDSKQILRAWEAIGRGTRDLLLRQLLSDNSEISAQSKVPSKRLLQQLRRFLDKGLSYDVYDWSRPKLVNSLEDARSSLLLQISRQIGEDLLDDMDAQEKRKQKAKQKRAHKQRMQKKRAYEQQQLQLREKKEAQRMHLEASGSKDDPNRNHSLSKHQSPEKANVSSNGVSLDKKKSPKPRKSSRSRKRGKRDRGKYEPPTREESLQSVKDVLSVILCKTVNSIEKRKARRQKKKLKRERKIRYVMCQSILREKIVETAFSIGDHKRATLEAKLALSKILDRAKVMAEELRMQRLARWHKLEARPLALMRTFLKPKMQQSISLVCKGWKYTLQEYRKKIVEMRRRREEIKRKKRERSEKERKLKQLREVRRQQEATEKEQSLRIRIDSTNSVRNEGPGSTRQITSGSQSHMPRNSISHNSQGSVSSPSMLEGNTHRVLQALQNTRLLPSGTSPHRNTGALRPKYQYFATGRGRYGALGPPPPAPKRGNKPSTLAHLFAQAPIVLGHHRTLNPMSPASLRLHQTVLNGLDACENFVSQAGGEKIVRELHANLKSMAGALKKLSLERRSWQMAVINALRVAVTKLWPRARVEVYGSFATGLCAPSSDIDLVICDVVEHYQSILQDIKPRDSFVAQLARHLRSQNWVQIVKTIERATVPIVKVTATFQEASGIQLDLSFDSPSHRGLSTCAFVRGLCSEYPMLIPLTIVLKQFLVTRGLNDPYSGGLSSYGLVLMITRILQRDRLQRTYLDAEAKASSHSPSASTGAGSGSSKKLPPTIDKKSMQEHRERLRKIFGSDIELGRLFITFLAEYGRVFDPARHAISVFNHAEDSEFEYAGAKYRRFFPRDPLAIIDPFDPTNNIGRTCYGIHQVQSVFDQALSQILGCADDKKWGLDGKESRMSQKRRENVSNSKSRSTKDTKSAAIERRNEQQSPKRTPLGAVFGTQHHSSVVKFARQLWMRASPDERVPPPVVRPPAPPKAVVKQVQEDKMPVNKPKLERRESKQLRDRATVRTLAQVDMVRTVIDRASAKNGKLKIAGSFAEEKKIRIGGETVRPPGSKQLRSQQKFTKVEQLLIGRIVRVLEIEKLKVVECMKMFRDIECDFVKALTTNHSRRVIAEDKASLPIQVTDIEAEGQGLPKLDEKDWFGTAENMTGRLHVSLLSDGQTKRRLERRWCEILAMCVVARVLSPPSNVLFLRALEHSCRKPYPKLRKHLMTLSLTCANVMIKSDYPIGHTVLPTLGQWIAGIVLAVDRSIWLRLLDLKGALIEARTRDRLERVIPFAVETISGCCESKVFHLPNPWLVGLLRCLKDIRDSEFVSAELQFYIDVLFRRLRINPKIDLKPR
mmetsp:Transcript_14103/g.21404  ORF Transcript_14103/g.21404 Transcript_14103/m.21404 type:complete len:1629 (+) Transcript_14103:41-4927(+)|eukprot:CAMPEP_0167743058 /NCGR_PEP_ID=MMETSP0110_2-20121227/1797_1 /TAXON_ID=629695 /ORGANISM="Gymnochlora sp., Strain CCMP2014" /LENGTH=1628 /DNA_ID=CAMNT_0007627371 /DNA_START=31 /DNA_END=4917 /DNA_ORIENTATION=-